MFFYICGADDDEDDNGSGRDSSAVCIETERPLKPLNIVHFSTENPPSPRSLQMQEFFFLSLSPSNSTKSLRTGMKAIRPNLRARDRRGGGERFKRRGRRRAERV